jgi:hypothetical protein
VSEVPIMEAGDPHEANAYRAGYEAATREMQERVREIQEENRSLRARVAVPRPAGISRGLAAARFVAALPEEVGRE